MRTQQEWFAALADELAEVRQLVGEIAVIVGDFSQALRVRIDKDSSLGLLTKLTALGSVLKQTGPLKPSWFDDKKRAELQQVAVKCQKQIDEANQLRNALSERMNAAAFDPDGESIAAAASAFELFWTRIWCWITGDWGRFVRKSAILYSQSSTICPGALLGDILRDVFDSHPTDASSKSPRQLLEDMSQLRAYHSLIRSVRNEENVHAADLICDEQGRPRWHDFASGIEAINCLRAIIAIPDRLKQVLTTAGMSDRDALDVATQDLESRLNHLQGRIGSLGQRLALTCIGTGKTSYADVSPTILQDWLQEIESAVRQRVTKLKAVADTLVAGRDVALCDLPSCLAQAEELCFLRGMQIDLRSELEGIIDPGSTIDAIALAPLVETARYVTQFLDTYGDSPPEGLLEVVTRREARLTLSRACATLASLYDDTAEQAWTTLWKCFPPDRSFLAGRDISGMPLTRLGVWLHEQAQVVDRLQEWIRLRETEEELRELRVHAVLGEVLNGDIAIEEASQSYLARFYRVWLDAAYSSDAALHQFRVDEHEDLITKFRNLDREAVAGVFKRIRANLLRHADRPHIGMLAAPPSSEVGILIARGG